MPVRLTAIGLALLTAWVAAPAQAQEFSATVLQRGSRATVRVVALDEQGTPVTTGTGVIMSPQGYVLTNFHVVGHTRNGNAGRLHGRGIVRIDTVSDSRAQLQASYYGVVVRGDVRLDLAMVKIMVTVEGRPTTRRFPRLRLAPATAGPGRTVAALGFPQGVQSVEITYGHVTNIVQDGRPRPAWLRLDARINPGSSGGPIIDRRGRVVGIATLIDHASAQPVELARPVQAIPEDWLRDAAVGIPMEPEPTTGVVTLSGAWFEEVAHGLTLPQGDDLLYYRVTPGAERVVVSQPVLEMAVIDASGRIIERGDGQVTVPPDSGGLAIAVLVPDTRLHPRRVALVAVVPPVQTSAYTAYVTESTAADVPVGTECDITVTPSTSSRARCRIVIECDGIAVYGDGLSGHNTVCETNADRVVVRVDDRRDDDGDPSMLFSPAAGRISLATGTWRLRLGASPPRLRETAGLPELPSRDTVRQVLASAHARVRACASPRAVGVLTARLTFSSTGEVQEVELQGWAAIGPRSVRRCIERILETLEVPEFQRPTMRVDYNYVIGLQLEGDL